MVNGYCLFIPSSTASQFAFGVAGCIQRVALPATPAWSTPQLEEESDFVSAFATAFPEYLDKG